MGWEDFGPAFYDETVLGERLQRVTFKGEITLQLGTFAYYAVQKLQELMGFLILEVVDSESVVLYEITV